MLNNRLEKQGETEGPEKSRKVDRHDNLENKNDN